MVALKKSKSLEIDERGRVTIPKEYRKDADSFVVQYEENGIIRLIPQQTVNLEDAQLIQSLRKSAEEYRSGNLEPMPSEWLS